MCIRDSLCADDCASVGEKHELFSEPQDTEKYTKTHFTSDTTWQFITVSCDLYQRIPNQVAIDQEGVVYIDAERTALSLSTPIAGRLYNSFMC